MNLGGRRSRGSIRMPRMSKKSNTNTNTNMNLDSNKNLDSKQNRFQSAADTASSASLFGGIFGGFFGMIIIFIIVFVIYYYGYDKNSFLTKIPIINEILSGEATPFTYFKLVLCIFLFIILINIIYYNVTYFEKTVFIKKKYLRTRGREGDWYMIVDNENNIYRVQNLWWKFDFNRAEDYNILEEGNSFKVKGYGIRFGALDMYPNIYSVENNDL